MGADGELRARLGPRRAERQQGLDGGGTALRGGALAAPARRGETAAEKVGGITLDQGRSGGDLRAGDAEPGEEPRDRAGAVGGAGGARDGGAEEAQADAGVAEPEAQAGGGEEGAGRGEAAQGWGGSGVNGGGGEKLACGALKQNDSPKFSTAINRS